MNSNWTAFSSALLVLLIHTHSQCETPASRANEDSPPKITLDAHGDPHFVEPPGDPVGEIVELVARAERALESGRSTAELLVDPVFAHLRPYTRFRELIRAHAQSSKASLVLPDEPGTRLTVLGRVVDAEGKPASNALVYAYQTSSKGWYAAEAPHVSGDSGDVKHARLFAYVRCASDGSFELATVRPGGYPRSTLPQHIHLAIDADDGRLGTEMVFEDDPRLTGQALEGARKSNFVILRTEKLDDGRERCAAEFRLTRR